MNALWYANDLYVCVRTAPTNRRRLTSNRCRVCGPTHSIAKSKAKRLPPILFSRPIITFKCARTCLSRDLFFSVCALSVCSWCAAPWHTALLIRFQIYTSCSKCFSLVYGSIVTLFGLRYTEIYNKHVYLHDDELISHGQWTNRNKLNEPEQHGCKTNNINTTQTHKIKCIHAISWMATNDTFTKDVKNLWLFCCFLSFSLFDFDFRTFICSINSLEFLVEIFFWLVPHKIELIQSVMRLFGYFIWNSFDNNNHWKQVKITGGAKQKTLVSSIKHTLQNAKIKCDLKESVCVCVRALEIPSKRNQSKEYSHIIITIISDRNSS